MLASVAGSGEGGVGFPADLGDLGAGLVAGGLRAGVGGVRVGAGLVSGFQRGLGVVPGGVHRRGGGLFGLDGSGGLGEGDGGFGLGLAAGGVGCGQRGGDPAGVGGGQLGGGGAGQVSGLGEQLLQAGQRAGGRGRPAGPAAAGRRGGCRCATCVSTPGCRTGGVRRARWRRAARRRIRAACSGARRPRRAARRAGGQRHLVRDLAGHGRGLSFSFPLGRRKEMKRKPGDEMNGMNDGPPRAGGARFRRGGSAAGRSGPAAAGGVAAAVDDLQPHPGRGGVLGRVPGEPARARRWPPRPGPPPGCSRWRS